MNYNEIVNRFKEIVEDHNMLVDFGYGQISDIKTRSEGDGESEGADYPYLFLNPGVHNREESLITYNFNMIIMDMAREEEASEYQNFLNIQSNCIQYCDDVIARLYYHYKDKPEISFTVSYTPFYERFQDQLAGATATISIQVPSNINECIAPFDAEPLTLLRTYDVQSCDFPDQPPRYISWRSIDPVIGGTFFLEGEGCFFSNGVVDLPPTSGTAIAHYVGCQECNEAQV